MYGVDGERDARGADRSTTCPATRAPGRCGSATARTTSASTTCGARCSTRSTSTRRRATGSTSASGRSSSARSRRRSSTGASPTAASGRCAASRSTSRRRRSCAGSPPTAAPGWPRLRDEVELAERVAGGRRRDPRRHLRQRRRRARRLHPALRHRRARRVAAADAAGALPAARRPADPRHGARHRRRAHRSTAWCCATGSSETDDGLLGRGGHVHDLLVLAGVGARRDRRARARAAAVREAALVRQPARPVRRGDRPGDAAATSATSRRRSPTWR